jgi:beta-glucosidase
MASGTLLAQTPDPEIEALITALIQQMTLEEKVGQLNLVVGDLFNTGPNMRTTESARFDEAIRKGEITGLFNIYGAEYITRLQRIAVEESRLGIPLLFGADVIHGFRTVTPVPLGESASWDMDAIEESSRVAALESSAVGISWTFAPMVDVTRDARWGRIVEGAGEDPFLGSEIARARVRGLQGSSLSEPQTIAACIKHFVGYGAAEAGREYNTVDMSEQLLRDVYLPPFIAGIKAGAASLMTSFNELNGIPVTGDTFLLRQILREEWGFEGLVVSDWQSITEMIAHGFVHDSEEAAEKALLAGCDMDMMGESYKEYLPKLIESGRISLELLDRAVRYVLRMKFALGLFDHPYQYGQTEREQTELRSEANLAAARDMARKSLVLLKNEQSLLPLPKDDFTIAIIGPYAEEKAELNGCWSYFAYPDEPVSIYEGLKARMGERARILTARGCSLYSESTEGFAEALEVAAQADIVLLALGEASVDNGEAGSRSDIRIPATQRALAKAIADTGKPTVLTLIHGRPMELSWEAEHLDAILACWTPGSETGHAIAEVLLGEYNPSGKLPVSFPRAVGQEPLYYNIKQTGRPYEGTYDEPRDERIYQSKYRDVRNDALYPFGFGLSYTRFEYGKLHLDRPVMKMDERLEISVELRNTGTRAGEEVVQLYIRDLMGSVTRPIKELKGFQKVQLQPGESRTLRFSLEAGDLAFWHKEGGYYAEPGEFRVFVGGNSVDVLESGFTLSSF